MEGASNGGHQQGRRLHRTRQVEVQDLDYPKLELPEQNNRQLQHGVILKVVATNICGSDQHMVRGRTTAPEGQTLGHEITGEVAEVGRDVEFIKQGDLVSVPFNIACGRCRNCKERNTGVCENVNPARAGAAYGYVDMGGWLGGQARYVTVPYADWNLLKFPDRDQAMEKIQDLAMLSDIFPTGYHGAWTAGVTTGSTVYVAGAGPVGLACATSAHLLGAAVVIVGDMNAERLAQAASFGCETINLSETDDVRGALQQILGGAGEVDAAVDCVGFEARGHGTEGSQGEAPATVLNTVMDITRAAGRLGIPGLYVTGDPGAVDEPAKVGSLSIRIGLGWAKSHAFQTGQCPVMKYNRQLMMAILHDKVQIARNVNATVIPLDQAPQGYPTSIRGRPRSSSSTPTAWSASDRCTAGGAGVFPAPPPGAGQSNRECPKTILVLSDVRTWEAAVSCLAIMDRWLAWSTGVAYCGDPPRSSSSGCSISGCEASVNSWNSPVTRKATCSPMSTALSPTRSS